MDDQNYGEKVQSNGIKRKDITHSIKTTSEIRQMYKNLVKKTGLESKDLFENMVRMYNTSLNEESADLTDTEEYKKCVYFTDRIKDLFISQYKSLNDEMIAADEKSKKEMENHTEKIDGLNKTISELNENIKLTEKRNDELAGKVKNAGDQYDELNEKYITLYKSVNIIQKNNDDLNNLVNEYKGYEDNYKTLDEKYLSLKASFDKLKAEKDIESKEKEDLTVKLKASLKAKDDEISSLTKKYEEKIKEVRQLLTIDKEKALIELDKKHLSEIARILKNNQANKDQEK